MQKWIEWLKLNKENIAGKTVIIDTNSFIHRFDILDMYTNDLVIIADVVLDELENLYKFKSNDKARLAKNLIFERLTQNRQRILIASVGKYRGYVDDILIDGCMALKNISSVTLVTGDKNLYMKAVGNGISASFVDASNNCIFRRHPDTHSGIIRTVNRNYPDSIPETSWTAIPKTFGQHTGNIRTT